ncbi:MAG: polyprenyl synthetase family protein [Planctomycetia bacterium]|nr:polyprenyl synthetase family protein [Planctomycetia bacterium]
MHTHEAISAWLAELRASLQTRLNCLDALWPDGPQRLLSAMNYSLLGGGKRLRPLLVLLAARLSGDNDADAWPAALAIEMVHTYSLIHDDLPAMDNDDFRRGRATCHKQYDEATAVLAGDALLTGAFEVLTQLPSPVACECIRILSRSAGADGMVGGQEDDVRYAACGQQYLTDSGREPSDFLNRMHHRKTGALIRAALLMGATVGGASDSLKESLICYGNSFGLAFQITDDILDVLGTEQAMGKRVAKDAGAGKLTFVTCWGLEESRRRAKLEVEHALAALAHCDQKNPACLALQSLVSELPERTH